MPRFAVGVTPASKGSFSASLVDRSGQIASISLDIADTVTEPETEALALAIADVSNAGLLSYVNSQKKAIAVTNALTYDDAENNVATKAELVFMDNNLNTRSVSVPAPDAQFFGEDGKTVTNTGLMATAITAIELVLNGGATGTGTYAYQRGYLVNRTRKVVKSATKPTMTEPNILQPPSDAPAS